MQLCWAGLCRLTAAQAVVEHKSEVEEVRAAAEELRLAAEQNRLAAEALRRATELQAKAAAVTASNLIGRFMGIPVVSVRWMRTSADQEI